MRLYVVTLSCHEYIHDSGCMGVFRTFDAALQHVLKNLQTVQEIYETAPTYMVRESFWGKTRYLLRQELELRLCRDGHVFDEAGDRWAIRAWRLGQGVMWSEERPPVGSLHFREIPIQ